jgi:hypothetical protein
MLGLQELRMDSRGSVPPNDLPIAAGVDGDRKLIGLLDGAIGTSVTG